MRFERINFQIENATKLTENELNKQEGGTTEIWIEGGGERGGACFVRRHLVGPMSAE